MEAPLSGDENNYPVLVFSHGMDGMRSLNTFQMEEPASGVILLLVLNMHLPPAERYSVMVHWEG